MQALERNGSMVSVMAPLSQVQQALQGYEQQVSVAAENGPSSVVISGECESVSLVSGRLSDSGVAVRELVVSHAFHSPLMDPMLEELSADDSVCVGDNEPYQIDHKDYGIPVHAEARGIAHVLIEIRQDLISSQRGQLAWAKRLGELLMRASLNS